MRFVGAGSSERSPRRQRTRHALRAASILAVAGAAVLAGLAAGGAASTTAPVAQNYFGWTSKGMPLQLDIHGHVITKESFIDGVLWHTCPATMPCLKKRWPTDTISLAPYKEIPFAGNRISYRRSDRGTDWWIEARIAQGGRVISGWIRQATHWAGYAPADSGKVQFTARLWASSAGVEWTGKTSDGKPLTMRVGYRSILAKVPISVAGLSRQLSCRDSGGAASPQQVTVPKIEGELSNLYFRGDPKYRFAGHSLTAARGSVTTDAGLAVRATLSVSKLAPQGRSLVATGTLKLEAAGCDPLTATFTLQPR